MALTSEQVVQLIESRGFSVKKESGGWAVYHEKTRVRTPLAATFSGAVEEAALELDRRESSEVERRGRRLILAQQRGDFYHRPRLVQQPDPETGEPTERVVFDIYRADGKITAIVGRNSVWRAWQDLGNSPL